MNTTRNKGGRPSLPKGMKKTKQYTVHLNPLEDAVVRANAKQAGLKVPELLAKSAQQVTIKALSTPEECELLRLVANFANNTNQLAHAANVMGYEDAARMYHATVQFFAQLLHRIQTR